MIGALIITIVWTLLPAAVANLVPPLVKPIPILDQPIDGGMTFRSRRLMGNNKTYRGFLFGILGAIIVVYIQKSLEPVMGHYSLIDYRVVDPLILGIALGAGALVGDALKSFFKRQYDIAPGRSWIFFDQIDWIVLPLAIVSIYSELTWQFILVSLVLFGLVHVLVNFIGWKIGVNRRWI